MHETADDIRALQILLDRSYERAGDHLKRIFTPERRISAERLPGMVHGVQVMDLATVTAAGAPRVAPVDAIFFRGRFWFGSPAESMRMRHIRRRPQVSGAITRGERFAVVVHGRAVQVNTLKPGMRPLVDCLLEVYGSDWKSWGQGAPYAQIVPERMFTYGLPQG